ncbi:hypothetical protein P7D77_22375, partial [Enterococcus avium]|nr:hypothetical protein [Enterococcus avium]
EFVKEWIDKHNLTKDSFDRIMNDLIYNSGHNYIDNPSLRYWLIDNTYKFRDMLPVELNSDQQVVLDWWVKKLNEEGEDADPLGVICAMQSYGLREEKIYDAAVNLTPAQQYQVLSAFAEWAQEREEE